MKKITLDSVIAENLAKDEEFSKAYQREMLINLISRMLVELRLKSHLTQKELAYRAGTTQPVIARLESGTDQRVPSLELLARIAVAAHAKLNIAFELDQTDE